MSAFGAKRTAALANHSPRLRPAHEHRASLHRQRLLVLDAARPPLLLPRDAHGIAQSPDCPPSDGPRALSPTANPTMVHGYFACGRTCGGTRDEGCRSCFRHRHGCVGDVVAGPCGPAGLARRLCRPQRRCSVGLLELRDRPRLSRQHVCHVLRLGRRFDRERNRRCEQRHGRTVEHGSHRRHSRRLQLAARQFRLRRRGRLRGVRSQRVRRARAAPSR